MCRHAGFHTPKGRYDRGSGTLRFVEVCDDCGRALRVVHSQPYRPTPQSSSSSAARKRSFSWRVP
jgi:hypothetical protein